MKHIIENIILHEIFRVVSRFPRYIHVIYRKIDYLWDSTVCFPYSDLAVSVLAVREKERRGGQEEHEHQGDAQARRTWSILQVREVLLPSSSYVTLL